MSQFKEKQLIKIENNEIHFYSYNNNNTPYKNMVINLLPSLNAKSELYNLNTFVNSIDSIEQLKGYYFQINLENGDKYIAVTNIDIENNSKMFVISEKINHNVDIRFITEKEKIDKIQNIEDMGFGTNNTNLSKNFYIENIKNNENIILEENGVKKFFIPDFTNHQYSKTEQYELTYYFMSEEQKLKIIQDPIKNLFENKINVSSFSIYVQPNFDDIYITTYLYQKSKNGKLEIKNENLFKDKINSNIFDFDFDFFEDSLTKDIKNKSNSVDLEKTFELMENIYGEVFIDNKDLYIQFIEKLAIYEYYVKKSRNTLFVNSLISFSSEESFKNNFRKSIEDLNSVSVLLSQKKIKNFNLIISYLNDKNYDLNNDRLKESFLLKVEYLKILDVFNNIGNNNTYSLIDYIVNFNNIEHDFNKNMIFVKKPEIGDRKEIIIPTKKLNSNNKTASDFYEGKPYFYDGKIQLSFNTSKYTVINSSDQEIEYMYLDYNSYYDNSKIERVAYFIGKHDDGNNFLYKMETMKEGVSVYKMYSGKEKIEINDNLFSEHLKKFIVLATAASNEKFIKIGNETIIAINFNQSSYVYDIKLLERENMKIDFPKTNSDKMESFLEENMSNYIWDREIKIKDNEIKLELFIPMVEKTNDIEMFPNSRTGKYRIFTLPAANKIGYVAIGEKIKEKKNIFPEKITINIPLSKLGNSGEINSIIFKGNTLVEEPLEFLLEGMNKQSTCNTEFKSYNNMFTMKNNKQGKLVMLNTEEGFYSIQKQEEKGEHFNYFIGLGEDYSVISNKYLDENDISDKFILTKHSMLFFDKNKKLYPKSFSIDHKKTNELNKQYGTILVDNNSSSNYINLRGEECSIKISHQNDNLTLESLIVSLNKEVLKTIKEKSNIKMNF